MAVPHSAQAVRMWDMKLIAVAIVYGLLVGFPIGFVAFSQTMPPLAASLAATPCFLAAAAAAYATFKFLERRSERYKARRP